MDLLKNAVGSIRIGVEDSTSDEPERLLSAVRNIHSGILLLYKENLRRLSPPNSDEVLLKAKMLPRRRGNHVHFVGHGKRTADVQAIKERFDALGIKTDWRRFDHVSRIRNDAEHYCANVSESQLRELIADAFVLVRDFIVAELAENPRELLGEQAWQIMLEVSAVFERERHVCEQLLQSIDWKSNALATGIQNLECQSCGSRLLQPKPESGPHNEIELECRACGDCDIPEAFIPRAIASALDHEMYLSYTDGNERPYVRCPECSEEAYVIAEQRCAHCGHQAEHTCANCSMEIPPEELDSSPYCSWCAHVLSKDD